MKEWYVFIKVVERGSITNAARDMNIVPSAVSKIIVKLELGLQSTLFFRNSRPLSVTPQGMYIYERVKKILESFDELITEARNHEQIIKGTIKLAVPNLLGQFLANNWAYEFSEKHHDARIFMEATDIFTNETIDNNDLIIKNGEIENNSLVHKKLSPLKLYLVATSSYLSKHSKINHPKDLKKHTVFPLFQHGLGWPITLINKQENYVLESGCDYKFSSNNLVAILNLVLKGHGISMATPEWLTAQQMHEDRLQMVLPEWSIPDLPVYLIWKQRQFYTPLFKTFSNFISDKWNDRYTINP